MHRIVSIAALIFALHVCNVNGTTEIPPHEHFSRYRDKHKRDSFFWPDDPWNINRVPSTFKVGFDVITDEAKGTLQYVTMKELDVSKFVQIEYVLGSSENNQRCIHPEFAKMTAYQKGANEAERPESIGLLPEPKKAASSDTSSSFPQNTNTFLLEKSSTVTSTNIKQLSDNDSICAPQGIMCNICLNAVSTKISTNTVQGGCNTVEAVFEKICKKVSNEVIDQEDLIKPRATEIYQTYGPKTGVSLIICKDLGCCGGPSTGNKKEEFPKKTLKQIDACICSYSPKKLRANKVKLNRNDAAKYVNQSRVRNMVDPIIATPDKYLKSLNKHKKANQKIRSVASILKSMPKHKMEKNRKIIKAVEDTANQMDNVWDNDWKVKFEISINNGKTWIQLNIPTKYKDRQSRIVKRNVKIPELLVKLGEKVRYRFTQYMKRCNCCSDLFVRSFSPKEFDTD